MVLAPGEGIYGDERRHQEMVGELLRIHLLLEDVLERAPVEIPATDFSSLEGLLRDVSGRLDRLTPASPEGIADALARRLPENPDVSPAMHAVATSLSKLDRRMKNLASLPALAMPIGELNGEVNVTADASRELGRVTVTNPSGSPIPTAVQNFPAVQPVSFTQQIATAPLEDIVVMPSATYTASTQSATFTNLYHKGLRLYLNVSAMAGTLQTLDVKLQTRDPVSGVWVDMPSAAFPQVNAVGTWVLVIYPGISQSTSGAATRVSNVMSRTWRVVAAIGGTAPSFTFSVAGVNLP